MMQLLAHIKRNWRYSKWRGIWTSLYVTSFAILCMTPAVVSSAIDGNTGLLVVNSNYAVKKYALLQDSFQANFTKPIQAIDLGGESNNISPFKTALGNADIKVVYAIGSNAYQLAHNFSEGQKIVHSSVLNWRRMPSNDATYGISSELPAGMQLMTFRYLFPDVHNIGVIYSAQFNKEWVEEASKAAKDMQLNIVAQELNTPAELSGALNKLLPKVDVLWLIPDPIVLSTELTAEEVFKQSDSQNKPVFAYNEVFAEIGAVLVMSADVRTMGAQAASLAEDLFANKYPAERVLSPAGSQVTLNMKKLTKYKMNLNRTALDSVNQIIE